ncbi:hypothetical protein AAVH_24205 [Aphelenchoides avenae]|nr:hypothetical protein AAVH_24205 [Aphelenchus avenae]
MDLILGARRPQRLRRGRAQVFLSASLLQPVTPRNSSLRVRALSPDAKRPKCAHSPLSGLMGLSRGEALSM